MRISFLVVALLMPLPAQASGEWQIKPFFGATFGGGTSYPLPAPVAGDPKVNIGIGGVLLGEIIGVEADFGHTSSFFGSAGTTITRTGVTTITGNIIVALPRHLAQYTLRPYVVAGTGLMRATIEEPPNTAQLQNGTDNIWAIDVGGGVTGFLTDRIGISWELRRFDSVGGVASGPLLLFHPSDTKQLSFWRATMAVAIRPIRSSR
jgi:hypothetical protein